MSEGNSMKVTVIRKIETEEVEVADNKDQYKERAVFSPNFAVQRQGEAPLEVVTGEEVTYNLHRLRHPDGTRRNYFVKLDERGLFHDLAQVSVDSYLDAVNEKVNRASENFYVYDLPNIKINCKMEARAELARLPFLKKLRYLFQI